MAGSLTPSRTTVGLKQEKGKRRLIPPLFHSDFAAAATKAHIVHEVTNQEDASPSGAKDVFRMGRVSELRRVKACAFVPYHQCQGAITVLEAVQLNVFADIAAVAVQDGIGQSFTQRDVSGKALRFLAMVSLQRHRKALHGGFDGSNVAAHNFRIDEFEALRLAAGHARLGRFCVGTIHLVGYVFPVMGFCSNSNAVYSTMARMARLLCRIINSAEVASRRPPTSPQSQIPPDAALSVTGGRSAK